MCMCVCALQSDDTGTNQGHASRGPQSGPGNRSIDLVVFEGEVVQDSQDCVQFHVVWPSVHHFEKQVRHLQHAHDAHGGMLSADRKDRRHP